MSDAPAHNETLPMDPHGHQSLVCEIAHSYRGQEVAEADLVVEGQRGLRYALKINAPAELWIRHYIRAAIVARHQGLVYRVALRYRNQGLDVEDLAQEGQIGLWHATTVFDPNRGTKFSTCATPWIRNLVRMAVINKGHTIRLPAYLEDAIRDGMTPESPGLSKPRQASLKAAIELRGRKVVGSRDLVETSLEELATNRQADFPDEDCVAEVMEAVSHLPERTARILKMRLGLGEAEAMTLKDVGENMGLTRERIRQIEEQGLAIIRKRLGVDNGGKLKGVG